MEIVQDTVIGPVMDSAPALGCALFRVLVAGLCPGSVRRAKNKETASTTATEREMDGVTR